MDRDDYRFSGNKHLKTEDDIISQLDVKPDGKVPPYNAYECEGRPPLPHLQEEFAMTEAKITRTCDKFTEDFDARKAAGYRSDEIEHICDNRVRIYRDPRQHYPRHGPVALMGSTGAGKSSCMNSLLNLETKAAPINDNTRGTFVPHEYKAPCMTQFSEFEVVALFLQDGQIESLVEKYCRDILVFLRSEDDSDDEEDSRDNSNENSIPGQMSRYDTAIAFFQTLLCNRTEFSSTAATERYFEALRDEDEAIVGGGLEETCIGVQGKSADSGRPRSALRRWWSRT